MCPSSTCVNYSFWYSLMVKMHYFFSKKRLEEELGIKLFTRDKAKVEITSAGEVFVKEAENVLDHYNKLLSKINSISEESNETIILGVSQFYGKYFIPMVLPKLKDRYPNMNIKIHEGESNLLEKHLLDGIIDLAIIPLPIQSSKVKYKSIYDEKILLAINSGNKKLKDIKNSTDNLNLSVLKDEQFVFLKKGFKLRNIGESLCSDHGFVPNVVLDSENLDTLNSLVNNNVGISLLPNMIQRHDNVEYIELDGVHAHRSIVLAYKISEDIPKKISNIVDIIDNF